MGSAMLVIPRITCFSTTKAMLGIRLLRPELDWRSGSKAYAVVNVAYNKWR